MPAPGHFAMEANMSARIFQDATGVYVVVGKGIPLEEQIGLDLEHDERAVRIPEDVLLSALDALPLEMLVRRLADRMRGVA